MNPTKLLSLKAGGDLHFMLNLQQHAARKLDGEKNVTEYKTFLERKLQSALYSIDDIKRNYNKII